MKPEDSANSCPHCHANPCLPWWRKVFLVPTGTAHCRVCGFRIGPDVSRALLAELPIWLVLFTAALTIVFTSYGRLNTVLMIVFTVLGLFTLIWRFMFYALEVPLLPDELTTRSMVEAGRARIAARKRASWGP
jgi:hypothetical protein